jgi:hypothetical protein
MLYNNNDWPLFLQTKYSKQHPKYLQFLNNFLPLKSNLIVTDCFEEIN